MAITNLTLNIPQEIGVTSSVDASNLDLYKTIQSSAEAEEIIVIQVSNDNEVTWVDVCTLVGTSTVNVSAYAQKMRANVLRVDYRSASPTVNITANTIPNTLVTNSVVVSPETASNSIDTSNMSACKIIYCYGASNAIVDVQMSNDDAWVSLFKLKAGEYKTLDVLSSSIRAVTLTADYRRATSLVVAAVQLVSGGDSGGHGGSGGGAVSSVSNSDSTLTISPTTGSVVASLNLGHANTWTATQTFTSFIDLTPNSTVQNSAQAATNTTAMTIAPNVADGASSVGLYINGATSNITAGSKLLSVANASTEWFHIGVSGNAQREMVFIGNTDSSAVGPLTLQCSGAGSIGTAVTLDAVPSSGHKYSFISTGSGAGIGAGAFAIFDGTATAYRWILDSNGNIQNVAGVTYSNIQQASTNNTAMTISPNVADGASSIGLKINNATSLTSTAKLLSIQNNGTNELYWSAGKTMHFPAGSTIDGDSIAITGGANPVSVGPTLATALAFGNAGIYSPNDNAQTAGLANKRWSSVYSYAVKSGDTASAAANGTDLTIQSEAGGSGTTNGGNIILNLAPPTGGSYGTVKIEHNGSEIGHSTTDSIYGGVGWAAPDDFSAITVSSGGVSRWRATTNPGYGPQIFMASGYMAISTSVTTNGTQCVATLANANNWQTNQGYALLKLNEYSNANDVTNYGILTLNNHTDGLADGFTLVADTGGVSANTICVFSGAKKVQTAANTANLTTWAGVAISTIGAGGSTVVATSGRVYVKYDGTVNAGDLLVTSGTTAGSVIANNAASAGAIIGRAMESGGASATNYVQMMMA